MATATPLTFADSATFPENLTQVESSLNKLDPLLATALSPHLAGMAAGVCDRETLLNILLGALTKVGDGTSALAGTSTSVPPPSPAAAPVGWFLKKLEIEGFRGINNEGAPLAISFKRDAVTSISAPNGVGKSSIYDAVAFALTGRIPKLEALAAAEKGSDYYNNRFHPSDEGYIRITLSPSNGAADVPIEIVRRTDGARTITAPIGVDGPALLATLNREFVLLDGQTFQGFMEETPLVRGRSFAGLLGLGRYSTLRQALQTLAHTKSFNTHFDRAAVKARKDAAAAALSAARAKVATDYENLTKKPLALDYPILDAQADCHQAIANIGILAPHCAGKNFADIDINACVSTVKAEEGGERREKHALILRKISELEVAAAKGPNAPQCAELQTLASARDDALSLTAGDLLKELYQISEKVLLDKSWPAPTVCPTCERDDGTSILAGVQTRLAQYEKVLEATDAAKNAWIAAGWADLAPLAPATLPAESAARMATLASKGANGELTGAECKELVGLVTAIRTQAKTQLEDLTTERDALAKALPPSLVAVTEAVETGRRLQVAWKDIAKNTAAESKETALETHHTRIKKFLDAAASAYATAESALATARLKKVEPVCQALFKAIMGQGAVPALMKKTDAEDLHISLAEFWTLKGVSAQALLSESYRNAFAVSVYLAAASLYGGAPRFMILDDVTSSFDAGHQLQLMNVLRTQFARPAIPDGPQVIVLSHDTMLEKLFNKNNGSQDWQHQRLEGTARTAVLLQNNAVNKVRDSTLDLLNQGRASDAAPFIRQYLEYQLNRVITGCKIPVPIDIAYSDDHKLASNYIRAIQDAVMLHKAANSLVLEPAQQSGLTLHEATIVSNYLSHWETGSTGAFAAPALLMVMQAIDDYADCFQHTPPGEQKKFYSALNKK